MLFGYTAQQTLESVQRLYDNKLATYPRTDSRYLTEDMKDTANAVINSIISVFDFAKNIDFEPDIQAVMNNKKVSDHHAIIPTVNIKAADLSKLTTTDNKILTLISSRLLSATNSDYVYDSTKITLKCGNTEFTTTGTTVISLGFKGVENSFKQLINIKSESKDISLPQLTEGESLTVFAKISEHFTTPPALYTEDTLLSAMENAGSSDYNTDNVERKGLGTPATRAAIIEHLVNRGFVSRQGKNLMPTDDGCELIKIVPDMLKSAKLTAEWESKLSLVAKGKYSSIEFMDNIIDLVHKIITSPVSVEFAEEREVIGKCPRCHSDVLESKNSFYCSNNDCKFALWKNNKFFTTKKQTLTKEIAKALLKDGRVHIKKLYSPVRKIYYEADILLDDTGGEYVNFKFNFSNVK